MKMPEKGKFEWNLNTIVILGGIALGILSTGITWGVFASRLSSADEKTELWQQRHEQLHRERLAQTAADGARTEQRLTQNEIALRKLDNLDYRITVAEQAGINTGKSIERLTETVNVQSADIRVMREIMERQFGAGFQRPARR